MAEIPVSSATPTRMLRLARRFMRSEDGATAIEYGLIASLISIAIISSVGTIGSTLNTTFGSLASKVAGASQDALPTPLGQTGTDE